MSHGLHELLRRMTCYRVQHTAELGRGPSMKTIGRHCTHGDQGVCLGSAPYIARHLHACWHDCKTPLCVASPIQQCSRLLDSLHPNLIISHCARSCTLLASYPSRACIAAKQSVTCHTRRDHTWLKRDRHVPQSHFLFRKACAEIMT